MKIKLLVSLLVLCLALPLYAAPPAEKSHPQSSQIVTNDIFIDANNIMMFVTNHGNFGRDLAGVFGYDYGTFYPYTDTGSISDGSNTLSPYYAGGLWIGAVDQATNDTLIVVSEYDSEYVPGPYGSVSGSSQYRVFKLFDDSLPNWDTHPWGSTVTLADGVNQDYLDYVEYAIDDGAPLPWVVDTTFSDPEETIIESIDTMYDVLGDQYCWAIYNDGDVGQHANDAGLTDPLGLEVIQEVFAFDREDPLGNVVFFRWSIWNRGGKDLDDVYFSVWSDPDLGLSGDDRVGCDIDLSVGYVYNADNDDQQYGAVPPCMGIDFFQGPLVFTDDEADTAKMWGQLWPGYQNMPMTSFNRYENGTDPHSYQETYWYMQGLRGDQNGAPYTYNGEVTTFFHSGDPVTGMGDLDTKATDVRMMQTTGPLAFLPGDSTEILCAMVLGTGGDRLSSVAVMKYYDRFAQSAYDIDFQLPEPPASPELWYNDEDQAIVLMWGDTSEVSYGDYAFQGYTIYQGEAPTGPWTRIANFDIVDGNAQILDDVLDPFTGALEYRLVKLGSDNGLDYAFTVNQDYITGMPLYNHTKYYFKLEAYSLDILATPKTLTSSSDVITVIPNKGIPEVTHQNSVGEYLDVTHAAGGSNGSVTVEIVDPMAMTGDDYQVVFEETMDGTVWHLVNMSGTTPDTILYNQTNQSGDADYLVTDGVVVRVMGPAFGVIGITETANGSGPLDPPDNVMWSLNSTADWYVGSDQSSNFDRMNWRGHIGTWDWEMRFTATGQEYYDWNTDTPWGANAPFEFWNIGIGTPDDPSDDMQINFAIIDDDASGGWSWGDRIYPWDTQYESPAPDPAVYTWDDDFHIGRIVMNDYSGSLTAPAEGTVIRFTTAKVNTAEDVFSFSTNASEDLALTADLLDNVKTVPNPYYLYGPYDPAVGNTQLKFINLPERCTISIYNLGGDFVAEVEKDNPLIDEVTWNVQTAAGIPVASGIYIYVVDAPGIGQKIGKMAIFTETQVLDIY